MFSWRHETVPKKKSYVHALIYKYMNKIKYNFINSMQRLRGSITDLHLMSSNPAGDLKKFTMPKFSKTCSVVKYCERKF